MSAHRRIIIAGITASMAPLASADVIRDASGASFNTSGYGFEDLSVNDAVGTLDLGSGVLASVTSTPNAVNRVFDTHDGYGAIASEGSKAWKIGSGTFTFDFGSTRLSSFGFWYSDLEWSDLVISFDNADGVVVSDDNSGVAKFFAYEATEGTSFSTVSIEFTNGGDGLGVDGIFANPVPSPMTGSAALAMCGLTCLRRRR